jgi:hypothetical protein
VIKSKPRALPAPGLLACRLSSRHALLTFPADRRSVYTHIAHYARR